jgi:hypothetical protein
LSRTASRNQVQADSRNRFSSNELRTARLRKLEASYNERLKRSQSKTEKGGRRKTNSSKPYTFLDRRGAKEFQKLNRLERSHHLRNNSNLSSSVIGHRKGSSRHRQKSLSPSPQQALRSRPTSYHAQKKNSAKLPGRGTMHAALA